MYGEINPNMTWAAALGASSAQNAAQQEMALSAEIMQMTSLSADRAQKSAQVLWNLRDRLFGTMPVNGGVAPLVNGPPQAFADAWRGRSRDLLSALNDIERYAVELSDRL